MRYLQEAKVENKFLWEFWKKYKIFKKNFWYFEEGLNPGTTLL